MLLTENRRNIVNGSLICRALNTIGMVPIIDLKLLNVVGYLYVLLLLPTPPCVMGGRMGI